MGDTIIKKILLLGFVFILCISFVNAAPVFNMTFDYATGINTFNNDVEGTTGILNGSIEFKGYGTNTSLDTEYKLDWLNDFSISLWLNSNGIYPTLNHGILQSRLTTVNRNGLDVEWMRHSSPNNNGIYMSVSFNSTSTSNVATGENLSADQWYNYVLTYNGSSGALKAYLNGSFKVNTTVINIPDSNYEGTLMIGQQYRDYANSGKGFNGSIDEFLIVKRILTQSEITDLYQSGIPTSRADEIITDSVYYSDMDMLSDSSDNNFQCLLPIGNIVLTNATINPIKSNNAFTFNGIDNKLIIGNNFTAVELDVNFSVSLWFKGDVYSTGVLINLAGVDHNEGFRLQVNQGSIASIYDVGGSGNRDNIGNAQGTYSNYTWYHVVATWSPQNPPFKRPKIYVNGTEIIYSFNASTFNVTERTVKRGLYIGGWYTDDSRNFNGTIDDVLIFPKVLNATEIELLYNSMFPVAYTISGTVKDAFGNPVSAANVVIVSQTSPFNVIGTNITNGSGEWNYFLGLAASAFDDYTVYAYNTTHQDIKSWVSIP